MHEGVQIGKKLFEGMLQENYQANSGLQKDVSLPNPQSLEFETFQTIAMNLDQTGPHLFYCRAFEQKNKNLT